MPPVKDVGEPCAGEPHARFEVAAGGNQTSRANTRRTVQAPPADPTLTRVYAGEPDDSFGHKAVAPPPLVLRIATGAVR